VFFGTGDQLKVFAVVSSYRTEPTDVIPSNPAVKPTEKVNVNSGFFIAYDIGYAMDAIHNNPIGAPRNAKRTNSWNWEGSRQPLIGIALGPFSLRNRPLVGHARRHPWVTRAFPPLCVT
jgi:hypothetical protein